MGPATDRNGAMIPSEPSTSRATARESTRADRTSRPGKAKWRGGLRTRYSVVNGIGTVSTVCPTREGYGITTKISGALSCTTVTDMRRCMRFPPAWMHRGCILRRPIPLTFGGEIGWRGRPLTAADGLVEELFLRLVCKFLSIPSVKRGGG